MLGSFFCKEGVQKVLFMWAFAKRPYNVIDYQSNLLSQSL